MADRIIASSIWKKIRPKIQQYKAITGRDIPPDMLRAFIEAELSQQYQIAYRAAEAEKSRELERERLAKMERQQRKAGEAALVGELVQLPAAYYSYKLGKEAVKALSGETAAKKAITTTGAQVAGEVVAKKEALKYPIYSFGEKEAAPSIGAATGKEATGLGTQIAPPAISTSISDIVSRKIGASDLERAGADVGVGALTAAIFGANPIVGAAVGIATWGLSEISESTVICEELCRQGLLPFVVVSLDGKYREKYIDDVTYKGYLAWAEKLVNLMRKSKFVTKLVYPFGRAWAYTMANKVAPWLKVRRSDKIIGTILLVLGVPACRVVGRLIELFEENEEVSQWSMLAR